jgi:hypothetical protein
LVGYLALEILTKLSNHLNEFTVPSHILEDVVHSMNHYKVNEKGVDYEDQIDANHHALTEASLLFFDWDYVQH